MKRHEFDKLLTTLIRDGILIVHDHYSDDGKNEHLETHYKINYGALT